MSFDILKQRIPCVFMYLNPLVLTYCVAGSQRIFLEGSNDFKNNRGGEKPANTDVFPTVYSRKYVCVCRLRGEGEEPRRGRAGTAE